MILATALASSVFTIFRAFLFYRFYLERRIDESLDELAVEFEERLAKAFEETAEELTPEFRSEMEAGFKEAGEALLPDFTHSMKDGFHEAGQELLPELRQEVQEGFKSALVDAVSGGIVPDAANTITKKGANIMNRFFGGPTGKPE